MNAETFIQNLEEKGIRLSLRGEKIVCAGPQDTLTPDLIETLRQRKPEIREWLKSSLGKDEPTPPPAEPSPVPTPDEGVTDTPSAPVESPGLDDWRKDYIEKEQSTWTPERRQAQADEIQRIEAYRRQRGPRPSGPPAPVKPVPIRDAGANWQPIGEALDSLEILHKIMWPTPPSSPRREPKASGPDIGSIVAKWPKHLRLEYAGRVGRYSNAMNLEAAMARAYAELRDYPKEN